MKNFISKFYTLPKKQKVFLTSVFTIATFLSGIIYITSNTPLTEQTVINDSSSISTDKGHQLENVALEKEQSNQASTTNKHEPRSDLYEVVKVVDGDTIDVLINDNVERLRLIGVNTPETVDPRKPVECFGIEASNKTKSLLADQRIYLESDPSQGERDKYNRLLRYVFLEDGTNFNLLLIKEGYAYEYTYDLPYKYQSEFKDAQKEASMNKIGLWGNTCGNTPPQKTNIISPPAQTNTTNSCTIKGNINASGEKIYHTASCGSYNKTNIDESKGEKWFCTEQEALDGGWRKALNCD